MKWASFVSLSMITHIKSWFCCDLGKPITKSIVIYSHFHSGIGSGCRSPEGFWCSTLTCWQVKHFDTYSSTSRFILSHQKFLFTSLYIFVPPGWMVSRDLCASSRMSLLRLSSSGTQSLSLHLNPPSATMLHSSGSFAEALANHFIISSFFCWASSMRLMGVDCATRHPKCRSLSNVVTYIKLS